MHQHETIARHEHLPNETWWVTALWLAHGLLRFWLFGYLMIYGWSKLLFIQMGLLDYADALYTVGEKSPMGLLWTFTAYSPAFQFLSGLVEVTAGILLIWRRTVWLGGLLGAGAMGFVFLLNLLYDVPVKLLALLLALGALVVLAPEVPRIARFVLGRDPGLPVIPRPVPWPAVHRVTRWVFGTIGVAIAVGPLAVASTYVPQASGSELSGVYRVVDDAREPADRLAEDTRWQEVAFGQYETMSGDTWRFTLRYANGDLHEGRYEMVGNDTIEVRLMPVLEGARPLNQDFEETISLEWSADADGRVTLSGDGVDLVLEPDPELRFLYDREFSWIGTPVNR